MVFIQDIDGKTPLTLTCDAACELFKGDQNSYDREPPSFQVVEVLLKASVSSVRYELPFAIIKYKPVADAIESTVCPNASRNVLLYPGVSPVGLGVVMTWLLAACNTSRSCGTMTDLLMIERS